MDLHSFSCNMKEKRSRFIVSTISTAHYCHFMNIITKKRVLFPSDRFTYYMYAAQRLFGINGTYTTFLKTILSYLFITNL